MTRTGGIIFTLFSAAIYGLYPSAARAAYAEGGNVVFMLLISTAWRALALSLFCLVRGKGLFTGRAQLGEVTAAGFLQALSTLTLFAALSFLPGAVTIIIVFTFPLMLLLFLVWRGEATLDRVTLLIMLVALGGLSLVVDAWHPQALSLAGIGLSFLAAFATMVRIYLFGRLSLTKDPAVIGAEVYLIACGFTLLVPLFSAPAVPETMAGIGWAFLAGSALALASFGIFYGIAALGSFHYSLLSKLEPVFTALFAALLIGEYLSWSRYLGMAIVLGSLVAYQYVSDRRAKRAVVLAGTGK